MSVGTRREVRKHLRKLYSLLASREMPETCSICLDNLDLDAIPYRPFEVRWPTVGKPPPGKQTPRWWKQDWSLEVPGKVGEPILSRPMAALCPFIARSPPRPGSRCDVCDAPPC